MVSTSLLKRIFIITWCTCSTRALARAFLFVVKTGLILKSFSKGVNYFLNSEPLSNTDLRGCGYLYSHVLLNKWLTLEDYLYMYSSLPPVTSSRSNIGISKILIRPVAGSIILIQVRLTFFQTTDPHECCCIIYLLYVPIRYICTKYHGFSSEILLGGRCPKIAFLFLNC